MQTENNRSEHAVEKGLDRLTKIMVLCPNVALGSATATKLKMCACSQARKKPLIGLPDFLGLYSRL